MASCSSSKNNYYNSVKNIIAIAVVMVLVIPVFYIKQIGYNIKRQRSLSIGSEEENMKISRNERNMRTRNLGNVGINGHGSIDE